MLPTYKKTTYTIRKNAVVLQSGGPTAVINCSLFGIINAWRQTSDKILYGVWNGIRGLLERDDKTKKPKVTQLYPHEDLNKIVDIRNSPSAALGSSRYSLRNKDGEIRLGEVSKIFEALKELEVGYVFLIGGEDSRENTRCIAQYAGHFDANIRVIHVPKTIDNDLTFTHHSPGYLSAAQFAINAVAGLDLDNRAMGGVMIDVVMGRTTGWIAAATSVCRKLFSSSVGIHYLGKREPTHAESSAGPHLIYIPESDFNIEDFLRDVSQTMDKFGRAHVVVSEGVAEKTAIKLYLEGIPGHSFLEELCGVDDFGHAQLSGNGILGSVLSHAIKNKLGIKRVRANTFDYLQRSFPAASEIDQQEAIKVGEFAVKIAREGKTNAMVTVGDHDKIHYSGRIKWIDLMEVFKEGVPKIRTVPKELIQGTNWIAEEMEFYLAMREFSEEMTTISVPNLRILDT